jgi:hypothetical protein
MNDRLESLSPEEKKRAIADENKRMRYLRLVSDFTLAYIANEAENPEEAQRLVESLRQTAMNLFPGKEETFELVIRPRFDRVIQGRFLLH